MNDMQPGQLIVPHTASDSPQPMPPSQPQPHQPPTPPTGEPIPERPPEAPEEAPAPMPAPEPEQALIAESVNTPLPPSDSAVEDIAWTAAEFIEREKGPQWYGVLVLVTVAIAAVAYLFTKDVISVGTILVVMLGFALFAARKPREQDYLLSVHGIQIGSKVYNIHDFKAFSITEEGGVISVVLAPLKRFMPPLTMYVAPEAEERVFNFLSLLMPFEQHRHDAVDSLMRRIRF